MLAWCNYTHAATRHAFALRSHFDAWKVAQWTTFFNRLFLRPVIDSLSISFSNIAFVGHLSRANMAYLNLGQININARTTKENLSISRCYRFQILHADSLRRKEKQQKLQNTVFEVVYARKIFETIRWTHLEAVSWSSQSSFMASQYKKKQTNKQTNKQNTLLQRKERLTAFNL